MMARTTPPKRAKTSLGYKRLVGVWARKIGVAPKQVQIQKMSNKWASCSGTGRLCFSRDLLRAPARIQNEVAVHELIHLIVPNHGRLFKAMYRAFLPQLQRF